MIHVKDLHRRISESLANGTCIQMRTWVRWGYQNTITSKSLSIDSYLGSKIASSSDPKWPPWLDMCRWILHDFGMGILAKGTDIYRIRIRGYECGIGRLAMLPVVWVSNCRMEDWIPCPFPKRAPMQVHGVYIPSAISEYGSRWIAQCLIC